MSIIEGHVDYTSAVAIYTEDYCNVDSRYCLSESMRPFTMGCLGCASRIKVWSNDNGLDWSDFIWLYEKGDLDQNDLKVHWNIAYPNSDNEPLFRWKTDDYQSNFAKRIRPFEAADLIGYENLHAHRLIERKQGEQVFEDLRKPMQRTFGMKGADKCGYLSEPEITSACVNWGIPPRL